MQTSTSNGSNTTDQSNDRRFFGAVYLTIVAIATTVYNVHPHIGGNHSLLDGDVNCSNSLFVMLWAINPFCSLARFLYFLSMTTSILLILLIAIERYLVLIRSLRSTTANVSGFKIILVLCWLFCIARALYSTIRALLISHLVKNQTQINLMLCLLADTDI
ncbi:hypothetical protein TrispH2_000889 [Trichoplax sp. H2]|nr:hypothetical protein TrispH2_009973 [Trichoplax sp. H2]RDD47561.1 hypothetical protein TrispH2_000889 [Trichoplax sp. H2]|eukprot:RDD39017.1 hypothetical protein TrispH2_009973 [Trichoplax sp. H2]